jgi:hypothetical protein
MGDPDQGISVRTFTVEVYISAGINFFMVGLTDSVAGKLGRNSFLLTHMPSRDPHHTISEVAN